MSMFTQLTLRLQTRTGQGVLKFLLSEGGQWFNSPGLLVEVSFGKILNPKLLLMCWSTPCIAMKSFLTKASAKSQNVNVNRKLTV